MEGAPAAAEGALAEGAGALAVAEGALALAEACGLPGEEDGALAGDGALAEEESVLGPPTAEPGFSAAGEVATGFDEPVQPARTAHRIAVRIAGDIATLGADVMSKSHEACGDRGIRHRRARGVRDGR